MKSYTIARVQGRNDFEAKTNELEKAPINCFCWPDVNKLEPVSEAVVARDGQALHVYLRTDEPFLRAEISDQNGPVYTDSCLEFFFMPAPDKSPNYINFEINPRGVFFAAVGAGRPERRLITEEKAAYFNVKIATKTGRQHLWEVTYSLPFAFIQKYVPEFDAESPLAMRGNFYKCGDLLPCPHWASWAPINTPKPDFHRPEFFADLTEA